MKSSSSISTNVDLSREELVHLVPEAEFVRYLTLQIALQKSSIRLCIGRCALFSRWLAGRSPTFELAQDFLLDLQSQGKGNSTLNSYIFALRQAGHFLESVGKPNPFEKLRSLPKDEKQIYPLSTEEIMKLITCELVYGTFHGKDISKELNGLYTAVLVFLVFTGCRFGEMQKLKIKDIDKLTRVATFTHTKNGKFHKIVIPVFAMRYIEPLLNREPDSLVFTGINGREVLPQNFSFTLRKRAKECGISKPVNPHNFRHSYGTEMRRRGMKIEDIARLLNHKDIQTTYKYYDHVKAEELERETMRHPLIRDSAKVEDIFKMVKEALQGFNLDSDPRFQAVYSENEIVIRVK